MSTKKSNQAQANIFKYLETIADLLPIPVYWLDKNNSMVGTNSVFRRAIGLTNNFNPIGKTAHDVYPKEVADKIAQHNSLVIERGESLSQDEVIRDVTTGETKYLVSFKSPLRDEGGEIVGLIGVSIDFTASERAKELKIETDRLRLENKMHLRLAREQEKFRKITDQVVHDIRSPLASLLMTVKSCEEDLPERARIALREAAISIGDIANNLLNRYQADHFDTKVAEERQPIILTLILLQILSEKKHRYKELPIKFVCDFNSNCDFIFIAADYSAFKRMISNIVNNAVDAIDVNSERRGAINITINLENKHVKIIISDNGRGMPIEVINKILSNVAVTANKKHGHGIGFTQINDTLQNNNGKLEISSEINVGTKITLTFPIIKSPNWIAQEIRLNEGDIVIVLDDDKSIHHAWDSSFKKYDQEITLKHFILGSEAIDFINNHPQKEKIFLLADFELLKQELNGLHVIEKTKITRSILVTSHYTDLILCNLAIKNGTKILPKPLASEIPIIVKR